MRIAYLLSIVFLVLFSGCSISPSPQQQTDYNIDLGNIATSDAISDVNALVKLLETEHYNPYLHNAKVDHIELRNKIIENWGHQDSIPKAQFALDIMKLLSFIEDGHTNIQWYASEVLKGRDTLAFFPLGLAYEQEQMIVDLSNNKAIETINGYKASVRQIVYTSSGI